MMQAAFRAQELNPAKLVQLYRRELELSRVKKGETIAVVSDLATRREYIQAAFAAADELGADIYELCVNSLPSWTKVGVPTIGQSKGTLEAVSAADMVVIFHVPLFTAEYDGFGSSQDAFDLSFVIGLLPLSHRFLTSAAA